VECWSAGVLECWNAGVLECWSAGMLECWGDFGSRFAVLGGGGAGRLGGGRWGRLVRGFRVPDPGFRFAVRGSRFSVLGSRCEALGVRECWSFGCWNARIRVDFLALVDPQAFQAWFGLWVAVARVGRARSSRPTSRFASLISLRRDRETSLCSVTPLAYSDAEPWECWRFEGLNAGMNVDFWRWGIRKPFRFGLVSLPFVPG
jgi:hypothetical protein